MKIAYDIHDELKKLHHHVLMSTEEGRVAYNYFKNRGISDEVIRRFDLGVSLRDSNVMINLLNHKGYSIPTCIDRGVVKVSNNGNFYDPFYNRAMFPIHDFSGRVCGFGGRTLDKDNKIKYLNSSESKIYKKQDNLYGFHQAKEAIENEGYVVLVEGYFDVLQAHNHGVKNIVASLGTALTAEQALLIKSVTSNVIVLLDNDEAGINASVRSASILEEVGVTALAGNIQNAEDPDEYFKKYQDKERFVNEVVKTAVNRKEFYIQSKLKSIDPNNSNQRFTMLNELLSELPVQSQERLEWLNIMNEHLHMPNQVIHSYVQAN